MRTSILIFACLLLVILCPSAPAFAGYIDMADLAGFADRWLDDGCSDANSWCGFADINRDDYVDFVDFACLAQYWEDTAPVPGQASNPEPNDTATDVSITADLSWTAGSDAAAHGVYFGTSPTPDANEFQGYQNSTTFDPGLMDTEATYYWRVDEVGLGGETTGELWSFTTAPAPGQASNPEPADMAFHVSTTADLSWTAGSDAAAHGVYFGTNPTPDANDFQGYQTSTTFDPGIMIGGTTYYWRVDEVGLGGTTTGDVWSFTTAPAPGQARDPIPADGSTIDGFVIQGLCISTTLSFTPGYNAVSHEAFFSDDEDKVTARDPCVSLGAGTATTYEVGKPWNPYPLSLVRGTWYYWCVDEFDGIDTWEGPVWSFYVRLEKAVDPVPGDGQEFVMLTPTLSWAPGTIAGFFEPHEHEIYFGINEAAVTDANNTPGMWPEYMGAQLYGDETWEPVADGGLPPLDYDTPYYWRIDERHCRGGPVGYEFVFKGDVWTFRTMPYIYPPPLVGWWTFDEGVGDTALDWSGYGHHGMLVDGIGNGLVWVPAEGALNFDGSNNLSRVMIPASGITTTAGTLAIWANLTGPQIRDGGRNGSGYFFGCDNGVKDRILLYMDNSNTQLDIRVGDHSENNIITLGTEVWYHIALTWNGGVYAVYVNGSERGTGTYGGLTSLPSTADIGNNGSSSKQSFHGLMGDVQLYDKSLSAAEIEQLYQDAAD